MSCQERDTSLFFSLLLAGEGFADNCARPPVVKLSSVAEAALAVGSEARILLFARSRYPGFNGRHRREMFETSCLRRI